MKKVIEKSTKHIYKNVLGGKLEGCIRIPDKKGNTLFYHCITCE